MSKYNYQLVHYCCEGRYLNIVNQSSHAFHWHFMTFIFYDPALYLGLKIAILPYDPLLGKLAIAALALFDESNQIYNSAPEFTVLD